jgi:hypothetical protein
MSYRTKCDLTGHRSFQAADPLRGWQVRAELPAAAPFCAASSRSILADAASFSVMTMVAIDRDNSGRTSNLVPA